MCYYRFVYVTHKFIFGSPNKVSNPTIITTQQRISFTAIGRRSTSVLSFILGDGKKMYLKNTKFNDIFLRSEVEIRKRKKKAEIFHRNYCLNLM